MTGISQRAYATVARLALSAVQKAIKTKRITPNADGTLDPERANQELERNTFAGKTLHQASRGFQPVSSVADRFQSTAWWQWHASAAGGSIRVRRSVAAYLRARAVTETSSEERRSWSMKSDAAN